MQLASEICRPTREFRRNRRQYPNYKEYDGPNEVANIIVHQSHGDQTKDKSDPTKRLACDQGSPEQLKAHTTIPRSPFVVPLSVRCH
jgi:hypothetical protein